MLRKIQLSGYRLWVTGLIALLPVLCQAMPVNAVNYKNEYKVQSTMYNVQTVSGQSSAVSSQTTVPSAGFQSTSVYAGQWSGAGNAPMLNADGSVNHEAYMSGSIGPRRSGSGSGYNPGTPDDDEDDDEEQQPLGDGLLVLMVLAMGYAGARVVRVHRMRSLMIRA